MSYQIKAVVGLRILVENIKAEEKKTEAGIIKVEDEDKAMRPKFGKVFQIGGKVNTELQAEGEYPLSEGETIAYDRATYPTVNVAGTEYDLIQKANFIGVC
jgi:co-chaperonin GroES (HSP10)